VAPAVVVPRILKPAQAKQYSNTYQMQSLRGHYGGVDSMSLTTHGIFDYVSPVTSSNDNAAIMGRKDVNSLDRRWTKSNLVMPLWLAEMKLTEAQEEYPNINDHVTNWTSATFVTFRDAIRLQAMIRTEQGSTLQTPKMAENDNGQLVMVGYKEIHFQPVWPKWLTYVHPCDEYGAQLPTIPCTSKSADHRLLWVLAAIHVTIPDIWESCANRVRQSDSHEGWLLLYIMNNCFAGRQVVLSTRNNPFMYPAMAREDKSNQEMFVIGMLVGDEAVRRAIVVVLIYTSLLFCQ
jgi:hypothetical protein